MDNIKNPPNNSSLPEEYNEIDLEALDLAKKLKKKELEIDEINKSFRYAEFDYKKKIQELQTTLQAEKDINLALQEKLNQESLLQHNEYLEKQLNTKQNELFQLKETTFTLKKQINQLKEKNFDLTTYSEKKINKNLQLERHFSQQIYTNSSNLESQQLLLYYEAENDSLRQNIEKIKEGAVEVLIDKEKEILGLKMKLEKFENFLSNERNSIKNSKIIQPSQDEELKELKNEIERANCIYAESLKEKEQERQNFIQEINDLNSRIEEREKIYQNRIFQMENENQHSLDQKLAEFWNSAQDNEQKLLRELQEFDDKLKIAERNTIILKNEIENKQHIFEKEKLELIQTENQLRAKIKEKEQKEIKILNDKQIFIKKLEKFEESLIEKDGNIHCLNNQINEILKSNVFLKNQIVEKDVKIKLLTELYENSIKKESPQKRDIEKKFSSFLQKPLKRETPQKEAFKKDSTSSNISPKIKISVDSVHKSNTLNTPAIDLQNNENKMKDVKETLSLSNFEDLESNNSSNSIDPNSPDMIKNESKINENDKEIVKLQGQNRQIMEKNEILLLFLKEKEEEIVKLNDKIKNLQILNEEYEKEINNIRNEFKKLHEVRTKSFCEKNVVNIKNDEYEAKIKDLETKILQTKEEWANLVNFLNEELSIAEKTAVEAKCKYVEVASEKEYFQYKYNDLLNKIKKGKKINE